MSGSRWDAAFVRAVEHGALQQAHVDALSHALAALTTSEERNNLTELHLTRLEFLADQWHPLGPPLGEMHVSGDTVIIQNLEARPDLNGTKHYVRKYNADAGRYAVLSIDGTGGPLLVKPLNLQRVGTRKAQVEQWYGLDKSEPIEVLRDRVLMQPSCGPGLGLDQPLLRREREQASPEQKDAVLQSQAIMLNREALARYVTGWCELQKTARPQTHQSQPTPREAPATRAHSKHRSAAALCEQCGGEEASGESCKWCGYRTCDMCSEQFTSHRMCHCKYEDEPPDMADLYDDSFGIRNRLTAAIQAAHAPEVIARIQERRSSAHAAGLACFPWCTPCGKRKTQTSFRMADRKTGPEQDPTRQCKDCRFAAEQAAKAARIAQQKERKAEAKQRKAEALARAKVEREAEASGAAAQLNVPWNVHAAPFVPGSALRMT